MKIQTTLLHKQIKDRAFRRTKWAAAGIVTLCAVSYMATNLNETVENHVSFADA